MAITLRAWFSFFQMYVMVRSAGHERRWRDDCNILLESLFIELGICLNCCDKGRLERHKHQHIVRRVDPVELRIVLIAQTTNMVLDADKMRVEVTLPILVRVGIEITFKCGERYLRIEDEVFVIREVDHYIRPV